MQDVVPLQVKHVGKGVGWRFVEPQDDNTSKLRTVDPVYDHEGDSGMRLYVLERTVLYPGIPTIIDHGIAVAPPPGYETQIRPRSSTCPKKNCIVVLGTCDGPYRGQISSVLKYEPKPVRRWVWTCSFESPPNNHYDALNKATWEEVLVTPTEPLVLELGDRVSQLVLAKVATANVKVVDELEETTRGAGGWGSTGR